MDDLANQNRAARSLGLVLLLVYWFQVQHRCGYGLAVDGMAGAMVGCGSQHQVYTPGKISGIYLTGCRPLHVVGLIYPKVPGQLV